MSVVTLWRKSTWHDRLDIVTCMKIEKRKSEGKDELLHNATFNDTKSIQYHT